MNLVCSTLIILFILLCPIATSSQVRTQSPQRPRTVEEDVVRVSTTLIQVDATVLDKNGKIVSGLTAEDFEIYENNKKQQITNFSFVAVEPGQPVDPLTVKPTKHSVPVPPVPGNLRPEQIHRTMALVVDDLGLS